MDTKSENLVLFVLGNQADNLGDTILNRNLVSILRNYGRVILDDSRVTISYAATIGVPSEDCLSNCPELPKPRKTGGLLRLLFGRKHFTHYARSPGHHTPQRSLKGILRTIFTGSVFALLSWRGVSVLLLGVTVTHANLNGMTLPLWRWHARKHEIFSVRDLTAFKRLKELKFSNLRHVPDLFFLSKFEELPSPPIDKPYFVINLRETYPGNPNPLEYQKEILARLSELLKQFPLHSLILCHQVERDGVFMEKVADSIADKHRIHHIASCLDEETALPLYQHADAILSNRLHCIMFGVLLNIPPYALTAVPHHVKITDAWREYKLDSYLLPSDKPLSQISLAKPNFDSLVHSRRKAILNLFE